jgi:hypothetical protein
VRASATSETDVHAGPECCDGGPPVYLEVREVLAALAPAIEPGSRPKP